MKTLLKTAAGIVLAIVVFLFFAVRVVLDAIGYTTTPDDWALLQARWPKMLEWLFSTPWWVPSLFMAGVTGLASWLLWSGLRGVAATPALDAPQPVTRADVTAMLAERLDSLPAPAALSDLTVEQVDALILSRLGPNFQSETVQESLHNADGRLAAIAENFGDRLIRLREADEARTKADAARADGMAKFDQRIETLSKLVLESNQSNGKMMELLTKRLDAVEAAAKGARDYAEAVGATQSHLLNEVREEIRAVAVRGVKAHDEQRDFQEKMERWVGNIRDGFDRQIRNIDQGFLSILDRENLTNLAVGIENVGDALSGPTRGEQIDDWDAWFKGYQVWRRDVENWTRIAGEHRDGVSARIYDTPDECYRGTWKAKDSYFPDATAVRDYRTFRIVLRNFHAERKHVENSVRMAAFVRPSLKGKYQPSPRDEDQLPQLPPSIE